MPEDDSSEKKRDRLARELAEHDRLMARSGAQAARDVLHDSALPNAPGEYTTYEARDRAAHTPAWVARAERDPNYLRLTPEELKQFEEQRRDLAERFPTKEDLDAYERLTAPASPPADPEELAQYNDFREAERLRQKEDKVTPEQRAKVDVALGNTNVSKDIGGASDVNQKPVSNDPTPIDRARDVGQDLQKSGVRMDKE